MNFLAIEGLGGKDLKEVDLCGGYLQQKPVEQIRGCHWWYEAELKNSMLHNNVRKTAD
jgi:hypothetical protein